MNLRIKNERGATLCWHWRQNFIKRLMLKSKRNIAKDTPGHNTLIIQCSSQPVTSVTSEDTKRKQIVEMLPNFKSIVL